MITGKVLGDELSLLGFGTMRLPLKEDGTIDEPQVAEMTAYAIEHGINYFDTAYPYHNGESERVIGRILKQYPRDSFYLANKYPGHQIFTNYDPAAIFEDQLKKCQVEYFDYYLLHNVYENSFKTYTDPKWGILDYFKEQKRLGRIKHLGFSCHGAPDTLKAFLDYAGDAMEFCQIQLNYLDWTLQDAKTKYDMLTERGIPIWVMEPVRGGKLANLPEEDRARLAEMRPDESAAAWGFRFLQGLPNVKMILSGMSAVDQMHDNVRTFEERKPLTEEEQAAVMEIAEKMKDAIPCTACRYCCDGCPMGLDIPTLLGYYNDLRMAPTVTVIMRHESLPEEKRTSACIGCGACARVCPQNLDIPKHLKDFADRLEQLPKWADLCRQREEEMNL